MDFDKEKCLKLMKESEKRLKISNQRFSTETALSQYVEWDALSLINFVDCRFEGIDFLGRIINFCNFKNSEFNDLSFRKCQFAKSILENCRIVNMDLTRAEFRACKFRNCDLSSSDFWECEFVETTFKNSNVDLIGVESVKFWKSNHCTEIERSSNFEKIIRDLDLIFSEDFY
jgi:uncharacterized protein YjbI with pentapeptide repeats